MISIGLPICLQMQGRGKRKRAGAPIEKKDKNAEPPAPHVPRKERRGEREVRDISAPQTADIAAVTTTEDTGVHTLSTTTNAPRSITKVSGQWSPEEEAELIKAVAKLPGWLVQKYRHRRSSWHKSTNTDAHSSRRHCRKVDKNI